MLASPAVASREPGREEGLSGALLGHCPARLSLDRHLRPGPCRTIAFCGTSSQGTLCPNYLTLLVPISPKFLQWVQPPPAWEAQNSLFQWLAARLTGRHRVLTKLHMTYVAPLECSLEKLTCLKPRTTGSCHCCLLREMDIGLGKEVGSPREVGSNHTQP